MASNVPSASTGPPLCPASAMGSILTVMMLAPAAHRLAHPRGPPALARHHRPGRQTQRSVEVQRTRREPSEEHGLPDARHRGLGQGQEMRGRIGEKEGEVRLAVHGDDGEPALASVAQAQARGVVLRHVVQHVRAGEQVAVRVHEERGATGRGDPFRPAHGDELDLRLFHLGQRPRRARIDDRGGQGGDDDRGDHARRPARSPSGSLPPHHLGEHAIRVLEGIVEAKQRGQGRRDVLGTARRRVRARLHGGAQEDDRARAGRIRRACRGPSARPVGQVASIA